MKTPGLALRAPRGPGSASVPARAVDSSIAAPGSTEKSILRLDGKAIEHLSQADLREEAVEALAALGEPKAIPELRRIWQTSGSARARG